MVTRTCNLCGTQAESPDDGLPEGWSFTVEGDRIDYQCSPCIRRNIRAIEGKLSTDWWE